MPSVAVLTPPTPDAEPLSLAVLKLHVRKDGDDEDELLGVYLRAARRLVEVETGRFFAPQTVQYTFSLADAYLLPAGAEATGVSGFFTDLAMLEGLGTYLEEYRKGITVSRNLPLGLIQTQTYTVTATVVPDLAFLSLAEAAILQVAAGMYRDREPIATLPVSVRVLLAPARLHVLGTD